MVSLTPPLDQLQLEQSQRNFHDHKDSIPVPREPPRNFHVHRRHATGSHCLIPPLTTTTPAMTPTLGLVSGFFPFLFCLRQVHLATSTKTTTIAFFQRACVYQFSGQ